MKGLLDLNIFDLELSNNYIIAGSHTQGVFRFDLSTIIITPTVTNPITGRTWMDRNLGASQVATSYTDELAYGDLYQWGRLSDGLHLQPQIIRPVQMIRDIPYSS